MLVFRDALRYSAMSQQPNRRRVRTLITPRLRVVQPNSPTVLFVVTRSGSLANGGVASVMAILQGLQGLRIVMATQPYAGQDSANVELVRLPALRQQPALRQLANILRAAVIIRRAAVAHGVNVIHCNDIQAFLPSLLALATTRARLVLNIRNLKTEDRRYGFRWQLASILASHIIVLSFEMEQALRKRLIGARGSRISTVYSIVDTSHFAPATSHEKAELRQKWGIDSTAQVILYVGAFTPRKGQLQFLQRICGAVLAANSRAEVHFVGDFSSNDTFAARCQAAARATGAMNRIAFRGYTSDIRDWYRLADVTVLASEREGLARCMIESIATGTPVVSSDVASAHEILTQRHAGIVAPSSDNERFVEALNLLLQNARLRQQMGDSGRAAALELFNADLIAPRYESIYRAVTN